MLIIEVLLILIIVGTTTSIKAQPLRALLTSIQDLCGRWETLLLLFALHQDGIEMTELKTTTGALGTLASIKPPEVRIRSPAPVKKYAKCIAPN